ncbi:MAG: MATE family efflux transporter [Firmicutes bacterium]|nr:MATE family efflux transporter [Bacillota bacterium]
MRENKMGTMPVNKLLISMAVPIMISMLVQALYNIVDSIFVAKYSADCMTAISLVFPLQSLMIATGAGIGVGMNALLSRRLGEKDQDGVNITAINGIMVYACCYILFLMVGLFAAAPFMNSQSESQNIVAEGTVYLKYVCCFSMGMYAQFCFERMLQSTGKTILSMITQIVGAVTNIILDPIMIFGLLGCPRMGMKGAAIATVIGQCVAGILALCLNLKLNKEIQLVKFRTIQPTLKEMGKILYIGIPSILMASIGSIMVLLINTIFSNMSIIDTELPLDEARNTAIAIFGIYFKLQSFIFMPVFGLNNGMVPIVAFCYGAGKRDRMMKTVKLSVAYAFALLLFGMAVFQLIPDKLLMLFANEDNMSHILQMGIPALRTISIHFPIASFCIISLSVFQALGKGFLSMGVSFARQLIVLVPVAFLLSLTQKVSNVWFAFVLAEVISITLCAFAFKHIYKTLISKIPAGA